MHYRLYFMNEWNGHIERAEDIDAAGDAEAIAAGQSLLDGKPMELWCDARKVHRFEIRTAASPSHDPQFASRTGSFSQPLLLRH